jgi:hypothetical protein
VCQRFNIRQLTDVLHCKLHQHFRCNEHVSRGTGIDMMAPTLPTELHQRRVQLTREPAAAAEARSQVRAAVRAWNVPVDSDIAVLLTSDLVTSAITHGEGKTVTLAIRCGCGHLRVDVYDTPGSLPMAVDEPVVTQIGHGLVLVAALSTGWGSFRTDAGRVMYFMLAFQSPPGSLYSPVAHTEKDTD